MAPPRKNTTDREVRPTGTFPTDLDSVQQAVDDVPEGGTVLLKALDIDGKPQFFHFGDADSGRKGVNVKKDVVILGESIPTEVLKKDPLRFPHGKSPEGAYAPDRTVIYGGQKPFHCRGDNTSAARLAVHNLYFAYPSQSAVQVGKSSGLEVTKCVVYDIEPGLAFVKPDGTRFVVAVGIEATGLRTGHAALKGDFKVAHTNIKRREDFEYDGPDSGIVVQLATMDVDIRHNAIVNFAYAGIGLDANNGAATIKDNAITYCGYGKRLESCGIGVKRNASAHVSIDHNTITCGSVPGPAAAPLTSKHGVSLVGASNVTVTSNPVKGTVSSSGILVTDFVSSDGSKLHSNGNLIERNDLKELVAGTAQELFETHCDGNTSKKNELGPVDLSGPGVAGTVIYSNDNHVDSDTYFGDYPGTSGLPQVPCVWLAPGTSGNTISEIERGSGSPAFDMSSQIKDEGSNTIVVPKKLVPGTP